MSPLILIFTLVTFAAWLVAEFKQGRLVRICWGIIFMVAFGFMMNILSTFTPKIESALTRANLRQCEELLKEGNVTRVSQAMEAYNLKVKTDGSYGAGFEMAYVLSHGPRK